MKRTGATILSLALAMILVSSLGSGVILAKGPKVHDVAIMECGFNSMAGTDLIVLGFHSTPEGNVPEITIFEEGVTLATNCVDGMAIMLSKKYKMQDGNGGFDAFFRDISRYTFFRTRK